MHVYSNPTDATTTTGSAPVYTAQTRQQHGNWDSPLLVNYDNQYRYKIKVLLRNKIKRSPSGRVPHRMPNNSLTRSAVRADDKRGPSVGTRLPHMSGTASAEGFFLRAERSNAR